MAGIGKFELGISLLPLLAHELDITELQIANADIQLETGPDNKHNWEMVVTQQGKVDAKVTSPTTSKTVAISADHVSITDSQVSIRDKNGKTSVFKTKILTYGNEHGGIAIHFNGDYNDTPIVLDVKTETGDIFANKDWPFIAELVYGDYDLKTKGQANLVTKMAGIGYGLAAGGSDIQGQLTVNWGGERPLIKGTLVSNNLNPADFKSAATNEESGSGENTSSSEPKRVFSDDPLPFDGLQSADAALDVNITSMTLGGAVLENVSGKVDLHDGHFSAPLKTGLGKSQLNGTLTVDAKAKPPQVGLGFSGTSIDLASLLAIAHAPAFLSGNANAELIVTTSGYSLHNLAGNANGHMNVVAGSGSVSSSEGGSLSSSLMDLFAPKGGTNALNCLVARFNITNGVVRDNGILVDSVATTVAGKGGFNLGLETIDVLLHARPKLVNVGGVLPPLKVGGTFANPDFHVDSGAVMQNVAGVLTSGSLSGLVDSNVPELNAPAGVNACLYTLDHPTAAKASSEPSGVLVPGVTGQIQKLKDAAPNLLKGLLGQ
jgi:uncharacterized protein involved in outer membrane biogenesis